MFFLLLLLSGLAQMELAGPPPFGQIAAFECTFREGTGRTLQHAEEAIHAEPPRSVAYERIDYARATASMRLGAEGSPITLVDNALFVSFLRSTGGELMVATIFKNPPAPAAPAGWKYPAVLSRHVAPGGDARATQSSGTCRATEFPRW
jgi:hypothetical protein